MRSLTAFLLISVAVLFHQSAFAQEDIDHVVRDTITRIPATPIPDSLRSHHQVMISAGFSNIGGVLSACVAEACGPGMVMARFTYNGQMTGLFDEVNPIREQREWAVMYGYNYRSGDMTLAFAGGLAIVDGVNQGKLINSGTFIGTYKEYVPLNYRTWGIPFAIQPGLSLRGLRLGLQLIGNFNGEATWVGGGLVLQAQL